MSCHMVHQSFPIISSSFNILLSSSFISSSLLILWSSLFSHSHHTFTRTLLSSCCEFSSPLFLVSRKVFRESRGVRISSLRELIYLVLSKRSHLFAFFSTCSSFTTNPTILLKVDANVSKDLLSIRKSIVELNSFCIISLCSPICGVRFWIFSQRFQKAQRGSKKVINHLQIVYILLMAQVDIIVKIE